MAKHRMSAAAAGAGILLLILDSKIALDGAAQGLALCIQSLIPSLFPFFFLSQILSAGLYGTDSVLIHRIGKLYHFPSGAEYLCVPSFLGGYPVGAQSVGRAYSCGYLQKQDAEKLLGYCSNTGPSFLFGIVAGMFPSRMTAWLIWGIQLLSCFITSCLLPHAQARTKSPEAKALSLPEALDIALKAMAQVCGWVILFRILIAFGQHRILGRLPIWVQVFICGLLELSNGCCMLRSIDSLALRFIVCNTVLAFSGFCVILQTLSVTEGLSLKYFYLGTAIKTIAAFLLSLIFLYLPMPINIIGIAMLVTFPGILQKRSSISEVCSV